jgi:hypothetical protein
VEAGTEKSGKAKKVEMILSHSEIRIVSLLTDRGPIDERISDCDQDVTLNEIGESGRSDVKSPAKRWGPDKE